MSRDDLGRLGTTWDKLGQSWVTLALGDLGRPGGNLGRPTRVAPRRSVTTGDEPGIQGWHGTTLAVRDLGRPRTTCGNLGRPGATLDELGRPGTTWDRPGMTWGDLEAWGGQLGRPVTDDLRRPMTSPGALEREVAGQRTKVTRFRCTGVCHNGQELVYESVLGPFYSWLSGWHPLA